MFEPVQQLTAFAGIAAFALTMVVIPLFFVHSGPPPARNVLTRVLVNMLVTVSLLIFLTGFRELVIQARPDYEWLGTLSLVIGMATVILVMVADSIQVGSVLGKEQNTDPTTLGSGGEAALLIWEPLSRLLTATLLIVAGSAILATGITPTWSAWLAYGVAAFHLALVPTIFGKTDPAHFYSINGWGIPVAGGLFLTWVLAVSVLLLM